MSDNFEIGLSPSASGWALYAKTPGDRLHVNKFCSACECVTHWKDGKCGECEEA